MNLKNKKSSQPNWEKEFDDIPFATCPIEEAEPFFWRWEKEGKETIKSFIRQLFEQEKKCPHRCQHCHLLDEGIIGESNEEIPDNLC